MPHLRKPLLLAALCAAIVRLPGQTVPTGLNPPAVASLEAALTKGKFSLDERLRSEYADQTNLKDSNALTLRTLFGYTTAPFDGFQAMAEAGNTAVFSNENDYSAGGTNPGGAGRTVVPEVPVTYINQIWASYQNFGTLFKVGRQRLVLDNARFVGDVNWWQKMQTFDAATLAATPAKGLTLFYGYVWHVSRIYGNQSPQPDFASRSNLVNASYKGWTYGTFTAYAYLLDFTNSAANSSRTYGGSFAGAAPLTPVFKVTYRAEAATQSNADNNPVTYTAPYYRGDLGGVLGPVDFGLGFEELGSDGGRKGFATPLATLHIFDGWINEFLTTPPYGLKDSFVSAGVALPGQFPLKVIYHDFKSDYAGQTYGHEWDGLLTHKFNRHWSVLLEVARFYGEPLNKPTPLFDTRKYWLETEFIY